MVTSLLTARNCRASWGLLLLICFMVPQPVDAANRTREKALGPPAPVGYAEPSDIGPLLDYRLPAWGWRTLDMGLQFRYDSSDRRQKADHDLDLESRWRHHFESENRTWDLDVRFSGHHRDGPPNNLTDSVRDGKAARLVVAGSWDQFVTSDVAVRSGLWASHAYSESEVDDRTNIIRGSSLSPTLGLVWGRLRNVGPLLRAQRLSERLVALGRPALSTEQVQATARLFAQHSGFALVYDRADKQFWGRVLDNLPLGEPLEPWEVMYLAEVLDEIYGNRLQGSQFNFEGRSWYNGGSYRGEPRYSSELGWSVYHNTSLNTQLHFRGQIERRWHFGGIETAASASVNHLWNIADRVMWTSSVLALYYDSKTSEWIHDYGRQITASTQWDYYVENTLVLSPGVEIQARDTLNRDYVDWDVFVHLTWFFDRALY